MSPKRLGRGLLRLLASLLSAALLLPALPALAGDSEDALDAAVAGLFEQYRLADQNFAFGFRALSDGTEYWYNEDKLFETASLYKLPLNMYFYELEASGEIAADEPIYGVPLDFCHEQSLVYSNNELSMAMIDWIGDYRQFKDIAFGYTGLDDSERNWDYYASGGFSARMMIGMLQTLYSGGDTFGQEIEYLKLAQPGQYLESGKCELEVAQKYGYEYYDGILNICIAGIVYTDEPFLITVLTRGVGNAGELMGQLCDAFAEYENGREHVEPVPPEIAADNPIGQLSVNIKKAVKIALCLTPFAFASKLI